jgi:dTDP-glucose 4,6-dehydratase
MALDMNKNGNHKLPELLKDRPVMVTGGAGFVGSHLTETLLILGAKVFLLVRPVSSGMLGNVAHIRDKITVLRGDLTDKQAVHQALLTLKEHGGQPIIFHLGAQAHVGESWARPYETFTCNAIGTLNLLQSVVDVGLDLYRLDTAGSSEEYGNIKDEQIDYYRFDESTNGLILDERSPINPQSIYATSKVAADFLTRNFYRAYGVPTVVTRMFNNYGPRQNPRFITGTVITQALSRDTVMLGYGGAKRDFCFVRDGALGHIHATLFGEPGEIYVYGHGENVSIEQWAQLILDVGQKEGYWGKKELQFNSKGRGRLGSTEVEELRVDHRKLTELTGWEPSFSWEDGIKETIAWYNQNQNLWFGRIDW